MIGLFLGVVLSNLMIKAAEFQKAAGYLSGRLLKIGIVLSGATLNFHQVVGVGAEALPLCIFNICWAFLIAVLVGRWMKVSLDASILVGGGTSICGGTAIATVASIIKAKEDDIAYAMTAIFLFDVFAALFFPYLANWLALSPEQYGILGGLAINDSSSVVAAGVTFDALTSGALGDAGISGGDYSVIVKLTRTTMLLFVALALVIWKVWHDGRSNKVCGETFSIPKQVMKAFPYFVLAFLALAVINTFGWIPSTVTGSIKTGYKFFITMALVGVGCKIQLKDVFKNGVWPIALGGVTWLGVAFSTLVYVLVIR